MPEIGLSSVTDMLIIAFLIYRVLIWIAKTRAWTVIKGISLLAVIYFLSDVLKLHTIRFLILNTFDVGLIALIVIFQPEVRKALEQIGKGTVAFNINKLVGGDAEADDDIKSSAVDEVISACRKMSMERTGALIVLANEVPLGDIEATGTRLDALTTHQLIISIFEDKMPLHDGAIVISKNHRIAAAGCILPLTEKEIGSELGTRHRAAVGCSEASDANVVVVSNETGFISIASEGKLYKNLSEVEIRSMLYGMKKPPKRKLASFFRGVNRG
jgi:diadenylate cyclase